MRPMLPDSAIEEHYGVVGILWAEGVELVEIRCQMLA